MMRCHGAAGERFVAADPRRKRLRRQDPGEHADGGAGVPRVEIRGRFLERAAVTITTVPSMPLDLRPQRRHAGQRRLAVRAGRIIGDACVVPSAMAASIP